VGPFLLDHHGIVGQTERTIGAGEQDPNQDAARR
jgi:hypothetical protein